MRWRPCAAALEHGTAKPVVSSPTSEKRAAAWPVRPSPSRPSPIPAMGGNKLPNVGAAGAEVRRSALRERGDMEQGGSSARAAILTAELDVPASAIPGPRRTRRASLHHRGPFPGASVAAFRHRLTDGKITSSMHRPFDEDRARSISTPTARPSTHRVYGPAKDSLPIWRGGLPGAVHDSPTATMRHTGVTIFPGRHRTHPGHRHHHHRCRLAGLPAQKKSLTDATVITSAARQEPSGTVLQRDRRNGPAASVRIRSSSSAVTSTPGMWRRGPRRLWGRMRVV